MGKLIFILMLAGISSVGLAAQQVWSGEWTHAGFVGAGWEGKQGEARGYVWTNGEDSGAGGFQAGPLVAGVLTWPRLWNLEALRLLPGSSASFWESKLTPGLKTSARTSEIWGAWLGAGLSGLWVTAGEPSWTGGVSLGGQPWDGAEGQVVLSVTRSHGRESLEWHERPETPGWKGTFSGVWRGRSPGWGWAALASGWWEDSGLLDGLVTGLLSFYPARNVRIEATASCAREQGNAVFVLKAGEERQAWIRVSGEGVYQNRQPAGLGSLSMGFGHLPWLTAVGLRGGAEAAWTPDEFWASANAVGILDMEPYRFEVSCRAKSLESEGFSLKGKVSGALEVSGGRISAAVSWEDGESPRIKVGVEIKVAPISLVFRAETALVEDPAMTWELSSRWGW